MSKIRTYFDWAETSEFNKTPRTRKYPWDLWFDGRIHELFPGVDFDGPSPSIERVARTSANRGLLVNGERVKVRVRVRVVPNESNVTFIEDLRTRLAKAKGERMTIDKETIARLVDLADGLDGSTVVLQAHDDMDMERRVTRSPSRASLAAAAESTNGETAPQPAKRARKTATAKATATKAVPTKKVGGRPTTAKKVARKKVGAPA